MPRTGKEQQGERATVASRKSRGPSSPTQPLDDIAVCIIAQSLNFSGGSPRKQAPDTFGCLLDSLPTLGINARVNQNSRRAARRISHELTVLPPLRSVAALTTALSDKTPRVNPHGMGDSIHFSFFPEEF